MMRNASVTTRAAGRRVRRAFSLAELMIAVVILGVGLLMVASMFPIAWTKARDQVEETNVGNAVAFAEAIVSMKVRVAPLTQQGEVMRRTPPEDWDPGWKQSVHELFEKGVTSFLGDIGIFPGDIREYGYFGTDTRVHPLNAYNMAANPAAYESAAAGIDWLPALTNEVFVPDEPHLLETADADAISRSQGVRRVPEPLVFLEDRFLPALPLKLDPSDPNAKPSNASHQALIIDNWFARLRGRRYAWAALARLNNADERSTDLEQEGVTYARYDLPTGEFLPNPGSWDDPRVFTVYCVSLRRTQGGSRFPRQEFRNGEGQDWPPVIPDGKLISPKAMPAEFDTVLPTPWRVQVYVPNPVDTTDDTAVRGLPGEVVVNSEELASDPGPGKIVMQILPRGAWFIDELSGQVYTVTRRRLYGHDRRAILTVDKEITEQELTPKGRDYDPNIDRLRTVWVYPPPVEAGRIGEEPVFDGVQPVISIETRTLVVRPSS